MTSLFAELNIAPPVIVGILNLSPDSFSGDGIFADEQTAITRARELIRDGASIVDVGGESTRPGAKPVDAALEIARISRVLPQLCTETFVSVDTYKSQTAEQALRLGARMINDVSALRADPDMARTISKYGAYVVMMYSKEEGSHPHATDAERFYSDVTNEICEFLKERVDYARANGIASEKIIVDPGMGKFVSHRPEYSFQLLDELPRFVQCGIDRPIMIGVSRKGFLGGKLHERDEISASTGARAAKNGAALIRTHNVKLTRAAIAAACA